ncbi:glycosyltransferase [Holdemanella porci]|uniref:glycosyltransferase n=1 Tax=Holdemanella porci TaxID=2652276 RepID=UPI0029428E21|nr:glycosyltransferase [Holdemanella porci]
MKILMINVVCGIRSTGRICTDLAKELDKEGHQVKIAYGRDSVPPQYEKYAVKIGSEFDVKLHGIKSRMFDRAGFGSENATKRFIEWVEKFDPDIIHLHNIHGYYINVEILFDYLRRCNRKIIWTLHDCWSFTGHCTYFDYVSCTKWKEGCFNCSQRREYPESLLIDNSKNNYIEKKKIFTGIKNLIIITPSKWLADLVHQSFLKEYPVFVINNGVDTDVFKKNSMISDSKNKYVDKKIILGVAAIWNRRKGLRDFIELSKIIDDRYKIIVVGVSENQINMLPPNIIGIKRTNSVEELSKLYNIATVFVNPTYEDNYPTTNLEAIACGTPVISYKTGGSSESALIYGDVVEKGDIDSLRKKIYDIKYVKPIKNFKVEDISVHKMILQYIELYMRGGCK